MLGTIVQVPTLADGIAIGFFTVIVIASILDKFGDAMFKRGVAKPFYILGHRLHHRHFLMIILPLLYSGLGASIILGYVKIVGRLLWTGLGTTMIVSMACLATDLLLDYRSSGGRKLGLVRHELIYLLIPAYAFAEFLRLVI
jgi:hypothetical protein